ncbi:MAG TPA: hypothetical protein PLI27_00740 [Ignavibacteriales bacterium]|nr:hypothetical protein [Ignavibacteriales bacterium]HOL80212.1 hypothetical protein [Ignavibacteriales bacterium]HOM64493.1 hypothetical protein [Ignavibacteriales bacterium]HPD66590.1 hypothetical protein [Ignavibacteriales bacterium]HPP32401.1 hypothetical protein [Ignavibacteriales bacterium]
MVKKLIITIGLLTSLIFAQEIQEEVERNEDIKKEVTDTTKQLVESDTLYFVPSYKGLENLTTISLLYGAGINNAFVDGINIKIGGNYIEDSWDIYIGAFYGMHFGRKNTEHKRFDDGRGGNLIYLDSAYDYKSSYYGAEIGLSIIKNTYEVIRPYLVVGMTSIKNDYLSVRTGAVNSTEKKIKTINATFFAPGITFFYNLDDIIDFPVSLSLDMNYKIIGGDYGHGTGFINLGLNYKLTGSSE